MKVTTCEGGTTDRKGAIRVRSGDGGDGGGGLVPDIHFVKLVLSSGVVPIRVPPYTHI